MIATNPFPSHPGTILEEIYMEGRGLNQTSLALQLGCKPGKVNEIVNGKRNITAEFALKLEKVFGTSPKMWLSLQAEFDLAQARVRLTQVTERYTRMATKKIAAKKSNKSKPIVSKKRA